MWQRKRFVSIVFLVVLLLASGARSVAFAQSESETVFVPLGEEWNRLLQGNAPLELTPYRIAIRLSIDERTRWSADHVVDFRQRLLRRLQAELGTMASIDFQPAVGDQANESILDYDKLMRVAISKRGSVWLVSARERDVFMGAAAIPVKKRVTAEALLLEETTTAIRTAFRHRVVLQSAATGTHAVVQAGELPPRDSAWRFDAEIAFFAPYMLVRDRTPAITKRRRVAWTYLRLEMRDRYHGEVRIHSAYREPLARRTRGIVLMGIEQKSFVDETTCVLKKRNATEEVLIGTTVRYGPMMLVDDAPAVASDDGQATNDESLVSVISDAEGKVVLKKSDAGRLSRVLVVQAGRVIVEVPFLIGEADEIQLPVPDESLLLELQGELAQLENELIDLVTSKTVKIALIRRAARLGQWEQVNEEMQVLRDDFSSSRLSTKLATIQTNALQKAESSANRSLPVKIRKMCETSKKVLRRYLENDDLSDLQQELRDLKAAQ